MTLTKRQAYLPLGRNILYRTARWFAGRRKGVSDIADPNDWRLTKFVDLAWIVTRSIQESRGIAESTFVELLGESVDQDTPRRHEYRWLIPLSVIEQSQSLHASYRLRRAWISLVISAIRCSLGKLCTSSASAV
jgi:hypothetical protein